MTAYALSELAAPGGLPRALHGLAARSPLTFARRAAEVAWEAGAAAILDRVAPLPAGVTRVEDGRGPRHAGSLALYLHWSPDGRISGMVRRQVALWAAEGFTVAFVSNAAPPPEDWAAIGAQAALCLARRNTGRDFGAWRDAAVEAVARFGEPRELLLANDSVLGPFRPLGPLVAAWRAGGEGLFGATESLGGGPHLQSYALLARGPQAVGTLRAHLAAYRDSRSKWRVVQQGELGLAARMRAAGVRQAALFGYARLAAAVDDATRASLGPRFADPAALGRYPLNPCHHLWRVLVERMGFPWLKTELVRRNPGKLPGVEDWPGLMDPADAALIRAHLALMDGG
ncbi:MAG: rhamnan synthesis F family protein [Rubritepida sp.]|nr:rhamnan synthesis F family protein [Rubritepida sp.]